MAPLPTGQLTAGASSPHAQVGGVQTAGRVLLPLVWRERAGRA